MLESVRTEQITPELLVDFAADGHPMGIEAVSPRFVTLDEINAVLDRLGLGRPGPEELSPLKAA